MRIRTAAAMYAAVVVLGCGSSDDEGTKTCSVQALDPAGTHYGKNYAQWAEAWVKWFNESNPTDQCIDPIGDATGELCEHGQDPASPVFFLAGTWGGAAKRTGCSVPSDKALFFPIVNNMWDNAGVPDGQKTSDQEMKAGVEEWMSHAANAKLAVDGCSLADVEQHLVTAPYTVTIPAEPNFYSCVMGLSGVSGDFPGWTSGYYVLLPPLSAGDHEISFSAKVVLEADTFFVDIQYAPLHVQ